MNLKNTLCGMLLVGAATSFGCDEPQDVKEKPNVEQELNYSDYEVRYGKKFDWFEIRAGTPQGHVELTYWVGSHCTLTFFKDDSSLILQIGDGNLDSQADYIRNKLYGGCYGDSGVNHSPKCPQDQLYRATGILENYKKGFDFEDNLKEFERKKEQAKEEEKNYLESLE
ncbi:MAG: hypothetical protein ABIB71_01615 [Candidatus Woesearchaeota archaeon]